MWNASQVDGPIPCDPDDAASPYLLNIDPALMLPALEPYLVEPNTPTRVFAGEQTVFLRFASEAEALASALASQWSTGA